MTLFLFPSCYKFQQRWIDKACSTTDAVLVAANSSLRISNAASHSPRQQTVREVCCSVGSFLDVGADLVTIVAAVCGIFWTRCMGLVIAALVSNIGYRFIGPLIILGNVAFSRGTPTTRVYFGILGALLVCISLWTAVGLSFAFFVTSLNPTTVLAWDFRIIYTATALHMFGDIALWLTYAALIHDVGKAEPFTLRNIQTADLVRAGVCICFPLSSGGFSAPPTLVTDIVAQIVDIILIVIGIVIGSSAFGVSFGVVIGARILFAAAKTVRRICTRSTVPVATSTNVPLIRAVDISSHIVMWAAVAVLALAVALIPSDSKVAEFARSVCSITLIIRVIDIASYTAYSLLDFSAKPQDDVVTIPTGVQSSQNNKSGASANSSELSSQAIP